MTGCSKPSVSSNKWNLEKKMIEENGKAKQIRMITEKGAFGHPGYMVIVKMLVEDDEEGNPQCVAKPFAVTVGTDEEQLDAIKAMKEKVIVDPAFHAFTVLKFIEETRPLEEPDEKTKIHIPTSIQTKRFSGGGNRSKYTPDGN